jgi:hypothetical protein
LCIFPRKQIACSKADSNDWQKVADSRLIAILSRYDSNVLVSRHSILQIVTLLTTALNLHE